MNEPHILYETEGHVAKIFINRPEWKNAFSPEMIRLWTEALERSQSDQTIRVIVITGNGDTFCSGGDIRDTAEGETPLVGYEEILVGGRSSDCPSP
jgi:enoyl-CoA hydratase/carnithine racemase